MLPAYLIDTDHAEGFTHPMLGGLVSTGMNGNKALNGSNGYTSIPSNGGVLSSTNGSNACTHILSNGEGTFDRDAQLKLFRALSRFLPDHDENVNFWWRVTGRHTAIMMHEAGYTLERQIECLLFHRFTICPRLGPKPTSPEPKFKSRVAPGASDGAPIGYSWRWGTGSSKPYIRHYIEPMGRLTGTPADPLNEVAVKEMLWDLTKILPTVDLYSFWKFAAHLRPHFTDDAMRHQFSGSSLLLGTQMAQDSDTVDVVAGFITKDPMRVRDLLAVTIPDAMRDAYGPEIPLGALTFVREFVESDPYGSQLDVRGTTAVDCCSPESSRFKVYVRPGNTSFDFIVGIMTLGGRKAVPESSIAQLKEVWYGINGLEDTYPSTAELPTLYGSIADGGHALPHGVSFYFDIHPKHALPDVKLQLDASKHAKSDLAAAEAASGFFERHGRAEGARAYMNMLQGIVSKEEMRTRRGLLAFFSFAFKQGEVDITSYFNPQCYRRYYEIRAELNGSPVVRQRRSLFE